MDGMDHENPFAIAPRPRGMWRALVRPLLLLAFCCAAVYGLHLASRTWLLSRLSTNLAEHPAAVQRERLAMLAEFGIDGLPTLVHCLAADDEGLARLAFGETRELQGRWRTGTALNATRANRQLVDSLEEVIGKIPARRHPWLAELLNGVVVDSVPDGAQPDNIYFHKATDLLAQLEISSSPPATSAITTLGVSDDPASSMALGNSRRLSPLPTRFLRELRDDDGEPPLVGEFPSVDLAGGDRYAGDASAANSPDRTTQPAEFAAVANSGQRESLGVVSDLTLNEPPNVNGREAGDDLLSAASLGLGETPFSHTTTRDILYALSSTRPHLQAAAVRELRSRGFTDGDMEMAQRLISTDSRVRLAMIDELPSRTDVDPRQWLLWLAADAERDVRLEAISVLGTMNDPAVAQKLRLLLREERDTTVASRLRRILGLR